MRAALRCCLFVLASATLIASTVTAQTMSGQARAIQTVVSGPPRSETETVAVLLLVVAVLLLMTAGVAAAFVLDFERQLRDGWDLRRVPESRRYPGDRRHSPVRP